MAYYVITYYHPYYVITYYHPYYVIAYYFKTYYVITYYLVAYYVTYFVATFVVVFVLPSASLVVAFPSMAFSSFMNLLGSNVIQLKVTSIIIKAYFNYNFPINLDLLILGKVYYKTIMDQIHLLLFQE